MYRCRDCGILFERPRQGRDETGPWEGCPVCGGEPLRLVECKACPNEVPYSEVSQEGLCPDCRREVLQKFRKVMARFQPAERAYLNRLYDGKAF